ncbi:YheE family protein [Metasolibacillus meyeri]|uniref:YheE family protein n=1 Tax=Metasolibacillus meyeri TaxID=1071052 RepID=A0AAW9NYW2_9BACL|nr:YheE family protein [Metasolibacillus meyeri]MEC1180836.1 YheE family protein [Metasolibacillus meyeri]
MIQHFHFKPLYENKQLPGWFISFFYKQQRYQAEYHKDGSIRFIDASPAEEDLAVVEKMVHELMLFHVYD